MSDLTPDTSRFQRPDTPPAPLAEPLPSGVDDRLGGRLRDLITRPSRLMDHVGARPQWWVPGLIIFVVMIVFSWLTLPVSGPEQMELMRDSKLMSMMPEDQWQSMYDDAMNVAPGKRVLQSLTGGFTGWLTVIIFGFILGFFARMSGGRGTFRQALGVTSWAALLPFAVGPLVKLPLVLATESVFEVNLGLAALLPGSGPGSPLFQFLLAYGDFLTWWGLAVLVIGFSRVFGLARRAAIVSVVLPWALLSLIPLGLTLLFM
ncbi:MAG: YIP1 family protein [bacterium]|nr:YIP1 family protein [bacterium]